MEKPDACNSTDSCIGDCTSDIIGIGYHEVCICDECAAELLAEPQFDYSVKFVDIPEEE